MTLTKVSVCIPVFNAEAFIEETITSVLSQTFSDFELIIVNNASTDQSLDVISKFEDPRIKVFNNEVNLGMVGNWNKCLEYSRGEYIKFLCADDIILPTLLEMQVTAMDNHPTVTLVSTGSYIINEIGEIKAKRMKSYYSGIYDGKMMARKSIRSGNIFGEPTTVMFRRKVLEHIGSFDENYFYAPDWDMWLKILYYGDYYFISEYLSKFRVSKVSATTDIMFRKSIKLIDNDRLLMNCHKNLRHIKISTVDESIHYINLVKSILLKTVFLKFVV